MVDGNEDRKYKVTRSSGKFTMHFNIMPLYLSPKGLFFTSQMHQIIPKRCTSTRLQFPIAFTDCLRKYEKLESISTKSFKKLELLNQKYDI